MSTPISFWIGFHVIVLTLLLVDLGLLRREAHKVGMKEAAIWCGVWVALSLTFNAGIYYWYSRHLFSVPLTLQGDLAGGRISPAVLKEFADHGVPLSNRAAVKADADGTGWRLEDGSEVYGIRADGGALNVRYGRGREAALEFLTGYLIEYSLSADNVFVFVVIFSYFAVPAQYQHRVLFWGILGAAIMRGTFIAAGTALLQRFHWIIYVFGVFLILTAIKLALSKEEGVHPERNPAVRIFRRFFPSTDSYVGAQLFTRQDGKWLATPLFLVLLVIETTDVVFALDSIPAIFAITTNPFIVYTSNICAILGLRSLYFLLAGMVGMFRYLRYGLAIILGFVGAKMCLSGVWHISTGWSLGVVAFVLTASIVLSLRAEWGDARRRKGDGS